MILWNILRAAGIGAYLMLFGAVAWGLIATSGVMGKRVSKASATLVHQFLSTVGLVMLSIHLGGLLIDSFMHFAPLDIVIPFHSSFRPIATALGVVAMYATVLVLVSSWVRKGLSNKLWRRIHLLAVPAFAVAMLHGLFAGTDTIRPWMWWIYISTGAIVVFLLIARAGAAAVKAEKLASRGKHAPATAAAPAQPRQKDDSFLF